MTIFKIDFYTIHIGYDIFFSSPQTQLQLIELYAARHKKNVTYKQLNKNVAESKNLFIMKPTNRINFNYINGNNLYFVFILSSISQSIFFGVTKLWTGKWIGKSSVKFYVNVMYVVRRSKHFSHYWNGIYIHFVRMLGTSNTFIFFFGTSVLLFLLYSSATNGFKSLLHAFLHQKAGVCEANASLFFILSMILAIPQLEIYCD